MMSRRGRASTALERRYNFCTRTTQSLAAFRFSDWVCCSAARSASASSGVFRNESPAPAITDAPTGTGPCLQHKQLGWRRVATSSPWAAYPRMVSAGSIGVYPTSLRCGVGTRVWPAA